MEPFFEGLTGDLVTRDDPRYEAARQEFNRAVQKYPLAILYCNTEADAARAVLWCRSRCVELRIRTGGHNYAGYSTGNNVLVIDLSRLKEVKLDDANKLVTVQGGATNGDVYGLLAPLGYPFAGGTCPTVGVSGLMSGGGWGLSCRKLGLTCDSLAQAEMIDYTGRTITASEKSNPDLFWALRRGGGGNFGIITNMTFRLPLKTGKVTYIQLDSQNTSALQQAVFWDAWQNWLPGLDKRMTLQAILYHSIEGGFAIFGRGIFYGTPEEALLLLKPFTRLTGLGVNLQYVTFSRAVELIGEIYPPFELFQTASRFVYDEFTPEELIDTTTQIRNVPKGSVFNGIALYALGGEVAETEQETSFYYRKAKYIVAFSSQWEDPALAESSNKWVQDIFDSLFCLTKGSFVNFPYSKLPDYLREYYGNNDNLLTRVKQRYDPKNVFNYPQSIPPV